MKAFWKKSWFISLLSLLIAVLLVIYTNYTQEGFMTQGQPERTKQTASEKQTVKVPLQVSVNTDNYYVVGYPAKVSITLEGSSALVTSAVNTQNFRVYIDLTHKSVGDHTVKIRVSGLSNQVSYKINPKSVHVNIQRRKSVTEPVQIEYNKDAVAHGYKLGKTSVYPQQVEITGARSEVDQIDQVVAKVTLPNEINRTYERQVSLIAEDKQGRQLNVIIDPATVKVTIPISVAKKSVKVDLRPQHEKTDKVYSLTVKSDYVTVYGSQEALKKVKRLKVPIDLKDVQATTTKEVKLPLPNGVVKAEPNQISVQIKVKESLNSNNTK